MDRFANWPSVERRIAQPDRRKKYRFGQQPVNSGQTRRIEKTSTFSAS
jgi:hypothetical protein